MSRVFDMLNGDIPSWQESAKRDPSYNGVITHAMIAQKMQEEIDRLRKERHEVIQYATNLAKTLHRKHWKQNSVNWKPLKSPLGVLTQIDNMVAALIKPEQKNI